MLLNMLWCSAPSSPSALCFEWLELGLCQPHFFVASWLLVRSSERREREGERPSFFPFLCSSQLLKPPVVMVGPGFQLLLALTEQGSWSFRGTGLRQEVQIPAPQRPSFGLLHPDTLTLFLSPALRTVAAS